jgi:hypothetical protein
MDEYGDEGTDEHEPCNVFQDADHDMNRDTPRREGSCSFVSTYGLPLPL